MPEVNVPLPTATRLSVIALAAISTVGAGLLFLLGYLARHGAAQGSVAFTLRAPNGWKFWLPGLLLAVVVGAIVALLAQRDARPDLPGVTASIFPAIALVSGLLIIAVYHDRRWWFAAPVVVWLAILIGAIARTLLTAPEGFTRDVARTSLTVVTYVVGFIALAMIYINKYRSAFSASAVAVIAFFLLLQMTDGEHAALSRRVVYAVVGALIVGQATWVINYWSATGWTGGAFLLAVFYLIAGLSGAQLRDRVQMFDIIEFGGVALAAIAIVSAAVWFQA
ncbi:MAG: hypothetical protein M3Y58_01825 [Chloroflexota bacterium]|nr:hypothetical protein [Chloroflexota bacterium]